MESALSTSWMHIIQYNYTLKSCYSTKARKRWPTVQSS
ncbi:hypothetical protein APHCRT_0757 [Anaplasma phagocytophilum str. CRT53-1]|uniref:Uncharacterized protein n=1 Tax=Anaplasma phagocytophilum str. CRT53-1 TaxID=1359157 RepID=A0A0F3Q401_ANAPH|nr:hypothetical protein APHCRT_1188 [Anaplasma phagocytophilum str. CRT53-1]KJV86174.1 hypothetical protein APHCRT_0757 [Anaplasma phagocytophilum str. CRT53-1]